MSNDMDFDFSQLFEAMPLLLKGAMITLEVTILGAFMGIGVGLILTFMRMSHLNVLTYMARIYISLIRGTPLLVQIFFIYYALPGMLGIDLPPFIAGVLALSLNSGAFVTEIIRGGITAVPRGQMEAAKALGIGRVVIWRRVILPQVFMKILPPLTNEFTMLVKASPLLSVITVVELTRTAQQIMNVTYRPVEVMLAAAVLYFIICFLLSSFTRYFEAKNHIGGRSGAEGSA
jgi:His/Glu/Gln/Arg/opine family amino acid ABC transporter permease subunit